MFHRKRSTKGIKSSFYAMQCLGILLDAKPANKSRLINTVGTWSHNELCEGEEEGGKTRGEGTLKEPKKKKRKEKKKNNEMHRCEPCP
jgi:hypothetical protein